MARLDSLGGKTKAEIFGEVIAATGGPQSQSVGAIKNAIDAKYPGFPWAEDWSAEVSGAKLAECHRLQLDGPADPPQTKPRENDVVAYEQILAARSFVEAVGGGSVERATQTLAYLKRLERHQLDRVDVAVDVWSELLEAVDGNAEAVDNVLDVFSKRVALPGFPRLANSTAETDAA